MAGAGRKKREFDAAGTLALLGVVLSWSAMPVFLRGLTGHVDAWVANGIRYPFAAIFYWPILIGARYRGVLRGRLLARALVPAGFSIGGQILWALAPYYLEASLISFLVKVSIVWVMGAAMLLFPEERSLMRSRRFWGGLALAAGGFVALAAASGTLTGETTRTGVIIIASCGAFFGLYGVAVRHSLRDVSPVLSFGIVAQYVSLATLPLMFAFGNFRAIPDIAPIGWVLLLVSSFLGIGISHVLFYIALNRLGATLASSSHLTSPFITLALASVFLGESLDLAQTISGIVMVIGGGLLVLAQTSVVGRIREDRDRRRSSGGSTAAEAPETGGAPAQRSSSQS